MNIVQDSDQDLNRYENESICLGCGEEISLEKGEVGAYDSHLYLMICKQCLSSIEGLEDRYFLILHLLASEVVRVRNKLNRFEKTRKKSKKQRIEAVGPLDKYRS